MNIKLSLARLFLTRHLVRVPLDAVEIERAALGQPRVHGPDVVLGREHVVGEHLEVAGHGHLRSVASSTRRGAKV